MANEGSGTLTGSAAGTTPRRLAVTAAAVALAVGLGLLLRWATTDAVDQVLAPGPAPFEALLTVAAGSAAGLAGCWLALGLGVAAISVGRAEASRFPAALTPLLVRRLAALLLGVAVVGGPLAGAAAPAAALSSGAPAGAAAGPSGAGSGVIAAATPALTAATRVAGATTPADAAALPSTLDRPAGPPLASDAGWTPTRPAPPPRRAAADATRLVTSVAHPRHASVDHVVVRRGDTLWDIAAAALGPDASAGEIAAEWPRWYRINQHVVGPDPALIRPGQLLRAPTAPC